MPESAESKQNKPRVKARRVLFVPRVMGIVILLIIILAFAVGAARQEFALTLTGAAFLLPWLYCLVMTLILALIHRRRFRRACIRISPAQVSVGDTVEVAYCEGDAAAPAGKILQLPGILVRCRLLLVTGDNRQIRHDFSPAAAPAVNAFNVRGRGAYFPGFSECAVVDILGFFRCAFRLSTESAAEMAGGTRLLVSPHPANTAPAVIARAGDSSQKPEFSFQRTDNFIDHRPYVPGDDPRRINWKLYGHGGGLFVREGDREPPPHSNIVILVDTGYDPRLYNAQTARRGIDALCEHALAAALACAESGMDVLIGWPGAARQGAAHQGAVRQGASTAEARLSAGLSASSLPARELALALAWPAARPLSAEIIFPSVPEDRGILILALPRLGVSDRIGVSDGVGGLAETNPALDRLLSEVAGRWAGRNVTHTVDLLFLFDNGGAGGGTGSRSAAETCAAQYNRRPGVRARVVE